MCNGNTGEIHSAYFGHSTFSIFTARCYIRGGDEKLANENVTVISEASDHSRIAAFTSVNKVLTFMHEKYDLSSGITLHVWSDGCSEQFRSRLVFACSVTWTAPSNFDGTYYNERQHGKGPMDGVGGTLKNLVYRDVMSSKCYIRNTEEFSNYVNKVVNGITSIYLPEGEQLTEPEDIDNSPKILETLSIHKLARGFSKNVVCFIKFFILANEVKPFYTQYYRKEGDSEVCGHKSLPLVYDVDMCFLQRKIRRKRRLAQMPAM